MIKNPPEVKIGDRLPLFDIETNSGETLSATDFDVGMGLIVFFNTECADCKKQLPIVQILYQEWGNHIRFLAISRNQCHESVEQYWAQNRYTIPYSAQDDSKVFSLFAPHTIPRSYLIKDGYVIALWDDKKLLTESEFNLYTK